MEAQVMSRKLPNINKVAPLNEDDMPLMREIYEVLQKHQALQRFGVTLLHEHFEVADDEVLVELTDISKRKQTIMPYKKDNPNIIDAIETSWRLDTGYPVLSCKCVVRGGQHEHLSVGK